MIPCTVMCSLFVLEKCQSRTSMQSCAQIPVALQCVCVVAEQSVARLRARDDRLGNDSRYGERRGFAVELSLSSG